MIVPHRESAEEYYIGQSSDIPVTTLVSPVDGSVIPAQSAYWFFGSLQIPVNLHLQNASPYSLFTIAYQLFEGGSPSGNMVANMATFYSGQTADLSQNLTLGNQSLSGSEPARLLVTIQPMYNAQQPAMEPTTVVDVNFTITN